LTDADRDEALRAHEELAADGFEFLLDLRAGEPWEEHVRRHERYRRGVGLPAGYVPATFLVAEVAGELVGRSSIRHELNDHLRAVGGHIGYGVRPEFRRRGHATEILRQSLEVLRELGVERALVTCDDDNTGSATVIERCGGRLENLVPVAGGAPKRRYWIDLA
jgi:predicted acetyltransferase